MKNNTKKPLVSIVTPLFNSVHFIQEAVDSVKAQTISDWELIIVNDGSNDGSGRQVEKLSNGNGKIQIIHKEKNTGPAHSRNVGIAEANGRYIAFLDSDDIWLPEKLEKQIQFMHEKDLAFSYSSYYLMDDNSQIFGKFQVPASLNYASLLKTNSIGCLTAIYDTEKLGKIFMPDIERRQDYSLWLKIVKTVSIAYGIEEPLAQYRIHRNSLSSNKFRAAQFQWRVYRDIEKLSRWKSLYFFLHYIINGLLKYKK